jgi:hypothetical protein
MDKITADDLAAVIALDDDFPADVAIDTAFYLIDDHCADSGYDNARLKLLQQWLAAHFYAVMVPQIRSETIGPISETVMTGTLTKGLAFTSYGQQVLRLDKFKTLAVFEKSIELGRVTAQVADISASRD